MRNGKKFLVLPALMAAILAIALVATPGVVYAQQFTGQFRLPGVIPPSGCPVGGIFSTEQFTTTGFSNIRVVGPNSEAVAGAWVIADNAVPITGVVSTPNCPPSAFTDNDDNKALNVMGVRLQPTIVSAQDADIREVKLVYDVNFDGLYDPALDYVLQVKPGSELDQPGGAVFWYGPQAPLFTLGDPKGTCDIQTSGTIQSPTIELGKIYKHQQSPAEPVESYCAASLLAVVEIGPNPKTGAQFGLQLEALAGDIPGTTVPFFNADFSSGFASSRNPQASNVRLWIVGGAASSKTPLEHLSNGSGNPESEVGAMTLQGLKSRFRADPITPGTREAIAAVVGLCDGGFLANKSATILPPIAGAPPTIAGRLGAVPCVPSTGTTDGFATGVNGAVLVFDGPLARYMQTVRMYVDDDCDGILFETGELTQQVTPIYNERTGEAIAVFGGKQGQILFTGNGVPVAGGCVAAPGPGTPGVDASTTPLIIIFTVDIDSKAPGGTVDVKLALQGFDDTAQGRRGLGPCASVLDTDGDGIAGEGLPGVGPTGDACGSNFLNRGPETFSFEVVGPAARPVGVAQFDTNANGVIDDSEFFAAIDQWLGGTIDDTLFFAVLDAWVSQTPVASARTDSLSATLRQTSHGLTLSVSGQGVASVALTVYDLSGRTVFSQETAGTTLSWNYLSSEGRPVANGVYLYVVTVKGTDGQTLRSEVRKLVVLR